MAVAIIAILLLLGAASPSWVMSSNIPKGTTCIQMCSREGKVEQYNDYQGGYDAYPGSYQYGQTEHMTGYVNGTPTDEVLFWVGQGY